MKISVSVESLQARKEESNNWKERGRECSKTTCQCTWYTSVWNTVLVDVDIVLKILSKTEGTPGSERRAITILSKNGRYIWEWTQGYYTWNTHCFKAQHDLTWSFVSIYAICRASNVNTITYTKLSFERCLKFGVHLEQDCATSIQHEKKNNYTTLNNLWPTFLLKRVVFQWMGVNTVSFKYYTVYNKEDDSTIIKGEKKHTSMFFLDYSR